MLDASTSLVSRYRAAGLLYTMIRNHLIIRNWLYIDLYIYVEVDHMIINKLLDIYSGYH